MFKQNIVCFKYSIIQIYRYTTLPPPVRVDFPLHHWSVNIKIRTVAVLLRLVFIRLS